MEEAHTSSQDPQANPASRSPDVQAEAKHKRKSNFSHEENEILVAEVTKYQHQLFVNSKLPHGKKEAIWKQIVMKINSVAQAKRTVLDCKKRWHDCKHRTKEKLAANRKAALGTGGGSPADQEVLDELEEQVAQVIPEEIVIGISGQDSAARETAEHTTVDAASTAQELDDNNVLDDMDDNPPTIDTDTLEVQRATIRSPTPPPQCDNIVVDAEVETQPPPPPVPSSTNMMNEWQNTQREFQRNAVTVQRELLSEVHVALPSIAAILPSILQSINPDLANIATDEATSTQTPGLSQSLENISNIMSERHVQMPPQNANRDIAQHLKDIVIRMRDMQQRQDLFLSAMTAFHADLMTVIKNQQMMMNEQRANFNSMEHVYPQTSSATAGGSSSRICPAPTQQSEDSEEDFTIKRQRKSGQ
ncbi:uncharacterized protein LOC144768525 [Lissotriton helveticus]